MKITDDFDSAAAKVAGSLSTDPIDKAAGEVVQAQKVQAKSSLYNALLQSPEMAARAQQLGRRTGLPADVVNRNMPEVERGVYLSDIDKMLDSNPAVVQFMTSPEYAAMAHDDVDNMGQVERKLRQFGGGTTEGLGMGVSGTGRIMDIVQRNVLQGLASILLPTPKAGPMGLTPQAPTAESIAGPSIGQDWMSVGGVVKDYARKELMIPQAQQTFGDKVAAGLGQVAGQVAMFPLDRGASMYAQGADVMGEKIAKDPASQGMKDLATLGGAVVTGVTERWALDKLLGPLAVPVKNQIAAAMARIGIAAVAEGGQEFTENVLQDTLRKALTNRDAEIDIGQSIEEGGVGAAVGGIVRSIVEGALHIRVRGAQAQVAQQDAQALTELTQLAQASKLAQRDPTTFQEFVKQATENGPVQDVYIDAKTFAQAAQAAGVQPDQLPPTVREQISDALATGGDVRIPIDEFAAQIATTEYAQGLLDHLKTDPLGMSRAEAQVFMQSQLTDLQTHVEKVMAEREGDQAFKTDIDAVRTNFTEQLNAANRFTPDVNTAYANMLANFYAVTAAKAGMTPQQLVERYPLRVQAEGVQGAAAQYDQAGQLKTDTPEFKSWFGESQVKDAQGKPLVVYRGTAKAFDKFDANKTMDGVFWFTSDKAKLQAGEAGAAASGEVMSVYLSAKNLAGWDQYEKFSIDELIAQGYDGIQLDDDYVIFEPTQIKSVDNKGAFSSTDSNIFNQGKTAERDLMVTHNLSADNLLHAAKIGGIAVPSLAITRKDTPLQGFGEITLIGDEKMADPKGYAATKVFGADIYSPRYPSVSYMVKPAAIKKLNERLAQVRELVGARPIDADEVQRNGVRELQDNGAVRAEFLRQRGIEPNVVRQVMTDAERSRIDRMRSQGFGEYLNAKTSGLEFDEKFVQLSVNASIQDYTEAGLAERYAELIAEMRDPENLGARTRTARGYAGFIQKSQEFANGAPPDTYRTDTAMRTQIEEAELSSEYKVFAQDMLASLNPEEKIFQGFTYSGNRRYSAHTLENVVKILKKELRGGEGFNYGVGSLRAKFTPQFKSIAQIRKEKGRLVDKATFEKVKEEIDNDLVALASNLGFTLDQTIGMLEDAPKMGLLRAAQTYQKDIELSDDTKQAAVEFLERLRHLPTEYFEAKILREVDLAEFSGAVVPEGVDQRVIDALKARGVTEIKTYAKGDEADRSAKIGQFDDLFFQGNRGQIAFGQDITQVPSIITLMKGADLSTFLHESGHFFLEVQFDLASRIAGEAAMFGSDTNTDEQRQLLNDTSELLRWFGLSSIEEWYALPMEEKRSYHEQFARGFEAYLFEGKAPSIELQGLFQRFRAWLMRVYRDLKALNVELTDEVRGVMDRMLATTDQIQLAEQGRSMMPLFTAPEQAGMTTEEFAAYQDLGNQASQDAIEDLQTRTLRDMQWMENAKGREIKRLKRESAARRSEMTIEARREIMSQPVYRAWQFLTGKLSENDKAAMAPDVAPKSTNGPVDPEVDSLFVAIAKLGGLKRDEVESQWGWDRKERSPQPMFGKPLLRRENGLSIDAMGELLAEYGYLPKDEHGKFEARDLEDRFEAEYRGDTQFSVEYQWANALRGERRAGEGADFENLGAGRLDLIALKDIGLPETIVQFMVDLKMTAKDGIHPDLVAESFGFTSGDEMVRTLAAAEAPKVAIEQLTDQKMLEKYGDLANPQAIEKAADQAIHNDTRARFVATELNALAKATGQPKVLASAARELAKSMIDRLLVRNVKPSQYAAAEVRAAKQSERAMKSGDTAVAASEKRNQLINTYATRAAHDALTEVEKGLRFLNKFNNEGTRKSIEVDYLDQIDTILERFDLRTGQSIKAIDKRKALSKWIGEQEDLGITVELPEKITAEAFRQSYKDMSIEEFRGLVDSIKQIEHLGRLKEKLLTAADNRRFADVVGLMVRSIEEHAGDKQANNRTRDTLGNKAINLFKGFVASHRKVASLARELDGFQDAGPVWTYFIQSMNAAGDKEASMRADATKRLAEMLKPVLSQGRMGGKGQFFASLGESLNRGEQLVMALNLGNDGNAQRLLDGKGWTMEQVLPVMRNLSASDWQFVQSVWDFFESYRPQIAAKERRVIGKEPTWVEPRAITVQTKDGQDLKLRGGYFPIVYDPRESGRAEQFADAEAAKQMMKGAFVAATTRRSFTKTRADAVTSRPLVLTWDALFRGVNDVVHDLAWHEWVIDANRIIKNESVDESIRSTYGADVVHQFKTAIRDIAAGDAPNADALSKVMTPLRTGAAVAGLGLNLMNAMLQPLGLTQSIVRVGPKWVAMGAAEWAKSPVGLVKQVHEKSEFMRNRARTQQRELNEIQSVVQGKSEVRQKLDALMFMPMQSLQLIADMPTWWGAYQKALAQADVDLASEVAEDRAVKLADQAVLDAQAGGQVKDLALIQRGGPMQKLFTVFYGYFSAAYNLGVERTKATNFRSPLEVMHLAWDYLLLYSVPAVLASLMKSALTPGGEDDDDPEKLAKKLAGEQISYLMGLMVGVREITGAVQYATGTKQFDMAYGGPAGLRFFQELDKLGKQIGQGELDTALRRSVVNVGGVLLHLPSSQINRTLDGIQGLSDGKTENPAALLFGVEK